MLCMLCRGSGTLQEAGHVEIEGWHAGGAGLWGFCVVPFSAGRASLSPPCLALAPLQLTLHSTVHQLPHPHPALVKPLISNPTPTPRASAALPAVEVSQTPNATPLTCSGAASCPTAPAPGLWTPRRPRTCSGSPLSTGPGAPAGPSSTCTRSWCGSTPSGYRSRSCRARWR